MQAILESKMLKTLLSIPIVGKILDLLGYENQVIRIKETTAERKKIIDNVARLYISIIKQDSLISQHEVSVLYNLLTNIFRRESISWEVYIRDIMHSEINLDEVVSYLNAHLHTIDKTRILLSLIVMSYNEGDFSLQDIAQIVEIAEQFEIESDEFMQFFPAIENKSHPPASMKSIFQHEKLSDSIFGDYIFFGRATKKRRNIISLQDTKSKIRFKSKSLSTHEFFIFMIEQYIFIGTSSRGNGFIDQDMMIPDRLYLLPFDSVVLLAGKQFDYNTLVKLYDGLEVTDTLYFKKDTVAYSYDFIVYQKNNHYTLYINQGMIYRKDKRLARNSYIDLFYDDVMTIKGYTTFDVLDILHERREIVSETVNADTFFIDYDDNFCTLHIDETSKSVLKIALSPDHTDVYIIYPPQKKGVIVYLNDKKLEHPTIIDFTKDTITINKLLFKINPRSAPYSFYDLEEIPFELEEINILDIKHYFHNEGLALDGISFQMQKNEMLAILGQSGCGKSTLLKTLLGEVFPTYGNITYDGKEYYDNINFYSQFVGYVPQDDILFSHLSVYENLYYRGKLRMPKISKELLDQKINTILLKTNLSHKKDSLVGDVKNKLLSGGERKRLNLALELLFDPCIIICDEPTSGLSYLDAEQVIDILKRYAEQGKFVILTIHQPRTQVFHKFDKVLIMDIGGKQVFFGKPTEVWSYFDIEYQQTTINRDKITEKKNEMLPEYVNFIIEYPDYRETGEIVYEKMGKNVVPKRKFPPDYWRDKYKKKMLFDIIQHEDKKPNPTKASHRKHKKIDILTGLKQLMSFYRRNLKMKSRNKTNLFITFLGAPLLALIIAFILKLSPDGEVYSFFQNINMGIYIFISIIVFIFLGMSSSIEEILSERKSIIREKMLNMKVLYFVSSKLMVLSLFCMLQVVLYLIISCHILSIKGMFFVYFIYLSMAGFIGNSIGILVSSFLSDSKAAINILPLVLIPQIILGGAIVEFEKMNRQLQLDKNNAIPEVVSVMPSYYLFEGLYTAQGKLNPHERKLNYLNNKRKRLSSSPNNTQSELTAIYRQIREVHNKYPKRRYTNEYINLSINMMDGQQLSTESNVFLSSTKIINLNKGILMIISQIIPTAIPPSDSENETNIGIAAHVPTYYFNFFIVFLIAQLINLLTILKIKYFYWK
jgi:ABC-type multidrug transport system ATPase subunit